MRFRENAPTNGAFLFAREITCYNSYNSNYRFMKISERHQALRLRQQGFSMKEIAKRLSVSKSTVSLWVRDVQLSKQEKAVLLKKVKVGQLVSAEKKRAVVRAREATYLEEARRELKVKPDQGKLICAMLFWCEGTKNPRNGLAFTNSDPQLVAKFLSLLRKSFALNESKFHPCIHLHSYHSSDRQLDFWSRVTHIKKSQFIKPYIKRHTGKRIHEDYQGCISIRYHSTDLARRLIATAKAFLESA